MNKNVISILLAIIMMLTLISCAGNPAPTTESASVDGAALLTEVKTTQYFSNEAINDADIEKILNAGINAPSAMNTQPWHFTAITDEETTQKLADAMANMMPPAGMPAGAPPAGAPDFPKGEKPDFPKGERPDFPEGERPDFPKGERPDFPKGEKPERPDGERPEMPDGKKPDFFRGAKKAGIGDAPLTIVISCEPGSELSAGLAVQNMCAEAQLLGYGTKILTAPTMALNGENSAEYKSLLSIPESHTIAAVIIAGTPAPADETTPDTVTSASTRNPFDEVVTIIK